MLVKKIKIITYMFMTSSFCFEKDFCTEYNSYGETIQEHYTLKCSDVKPPCPNRYLSTAAYLCKFIYAAIVSLRWDCKSVGKQLHRQSISQKIKTISMWYQMSASTVMPKLHASNICNHVTDIAMFCKMDCIYFKARIVIFRIKILTHLNKNMIE